MERNRETIMAKVIKKIKIIKIIQKKVYSIYGRNHSVLTKYAHCVQPLQVPGLQELCELVLGLSGPKNQSSAACLRGATEFPDAEGEYVGFRPVLG